MQDRLLLLITTVIALASGACTPRARMPASDVTTTPLTNLAGKPTVLAEATAGRVAVVALWATWCDACKKELPALARLDAKAKARGDFVVVGVAVGDEPEVVAAYASANRIPFAELVDEQFALARVARERVPTTLVLDREGHVVYEGDSLDRGALAALRDTLAR